MSISGRASLHQRGVFLVLDSDLSFKGSRQTQGAPTWLAQASLSQSEVASLPMSLGHCDEHLVNLNQQVCGFSPRSQKSKGKDLAAGPPEFSGRGPDRPSPVTQSGPEAVSRSLTGLHMQDEVLPSCRHTCLHSVAGILSPASPRSQMPEVVQRPQPSLSVQPRNST